MLAPETSSPKALAFWSYAHRDDELTDGAIIALIRSVSREDAVITGYPLEQADEMFVDCLSIKWGEHWRARIDQALHSVTGTAFRSSRPSRFHHACHSARSFRWSDERERGEWECPGLSIWLLVGKLVDVVGFVGCRDWSSEVHAFAEQFVVDSRSRWHLAPDSRPMSQGD
jgi:hypothetical protein